MIHLCLLAGGSGKRFGSNKLLAVLNGKPIWTYGYEVLQAAAREIGASLHVITRYLEILDVVGADGVYCPESALGLSFTVRAACTACAPTAGHDRLLFLAADQPMVTAETVKKLLSVPLAEKEDDPRPLAACASPDGKTGGNPVIFSGLLTEKLMKLTGDQGGKSVLRSCPDRIEYVICQSRELHDIDTPGDLNII